MIFDIPPILENLFHMAIGWRFPKSGIPKSSILDHFSWIFHEINHPFDQI
jgi:hypothetical protein